MKIKGIYQIKSKATGEVVYTAGDYDIHWDWFIHLEQLRRGLHPDRELQDYFNRYGADDYEIMIVEQFDSIAKSSLLEKAEKYKKPKKEEPEEEEPEEEVAEEIKEQKEEVEKPKKRRRYYGRKSNSKPTGGK